jgi:AAA ATPase domain
LFIFARLEGEGVNAGILESQRGLWLFPINGEPISKIGASFEINSKIFTPIDDMPYPKTEWDSFHKRYVKSNTPEYTLLLEKICNAPYYYFAFVCKAAPDFKNFESEFRFIFKDSRDGRYFVVANMQYNFREAFSNSAIMPAFRDPYMQMKIVNYNWYGKLMRDTWENAVKDPMVSQSMTEIVERMAEVGQPIFQLLADDINGKINIGFSGAKIRFQFLSSHRQDMHKNVKVYVNDGIDDLITRKGSGIQSAFIIGLFTYYCMSAHNTSILVVEEPEVFLHPHARRSISRRLDDFVRLKIHEGKSNQVIVTTHSSEIIQTGGVETISLIKKGSNGTLAKTFVFNEDFDQKEIRGILKTGVSEMLFADKVIICEGAEEFLIPRIADSIARANGFLDDHNISMINANGKKYIATMVRILEKLEIDWVAVVDFDFLDNTASNFVRKCGRQEGKTQVAIEKFHDVVQQYMGSNLPAVLKNGKMTSMHIDTVERAESAIKHFKQDYGLWILTLGSLEDYITEYGRDNLFDEHSKVDPSKLISVCLDIEMDIEKFFKIEEYSSFLNQSGIFDVLI